MKWVWRIAGGFTLLLVLLGLALFAVPTDRIARLATDKLEEATGRQLTINGELSARLWPRPGITASSVSLSNAAWSRQGPMLVAERMEVGISPGSILAGQIQIKTLSLTGAAITLERREDGIGNWETAVTQGETTGPTPTGPSIDTISLTGAEIAWIDHRADRTLRLRAVDLTAQLPDPTRPTALQGSALLGSRAIRLGGRVDNLANFMDGGLQHITLSLSSGGTAVTIDGRADLVPLAFDGTVDARSDDRMGILSAMGVPVPTLPEGLGGRRVALTAAATLAPEGSLHLRGLDLALDANRFTGDLDLLPGETRPRLAATLASPGLTLDTLSAKGLGGESLLVSETGWGRSPLDASGLSALDADIVLTTGPVRLGDARLAAVAATVNLRDARLVANLQPVRAYGGVIGGELVINARSDLSARAELDFEGVDIRELLDGFAGYDRISGQANASVAVVAEGPTAQAMVESLEGDVAVSLTNGEIVGVDLPAMIRDRQGQPADSLATVFDSASAQLRVTGGTITGDDIRIDAEGGTLVAKGGLDLGPRQVDLRITPARGATVPVLVEGRWTSPRVAVDRAYLRRQAEAAERARQEAAAAQAAREAAARREREEAATRARLARELGVSPDSLTDQNAVEEAVRRRVEQELLDLITGTD